MSPFGKSKFSYIFLGQICQIEIENGNVWHLTGLPVNFSYWWCCGARLNCLVMRDLAIVISAEGDGDRGRARATFKCV